MNEKNKWFFLILLASIWGSSFILMRLSLHGLSYIQLACFRILFACLFLVVIGFKKLPSIPLYKWKYLFITACCGTFFPAFMFSIAISKIDTSIASILNALTPLNTLVVGSLFFGLQAVRNQYFGVIIGFIGSFILIYFGDKTQESENYFYALLCVVASIFYGVNINLIKKYVSDLSPMTITVGNFVILFIPTLIILFFSGFSFQNCSETTIYSLCYVAVLGIIGTGLANIIFFNLVQKTSTIFASSVTYLIPVVAFGLGIGINNEHISVFQIFGAIVVLIGVYLTTKK